MEIHIHWLGNLAFALIFAILGLFLIFLHIPKSAIFKYYRYSRYTLGIGFLIITLYCCIKPLLLNTDEFTCLCFQLFFSLIVTWLTYSSFLFVIYEERFKRFRFFLDGIIPVTLMLLSALIGLKHPHLQKLNVILFGVIFGVKCSWMGYTCIREYKRCTHELENYYDNTPDIRWMYNLIWCSISLSVFTLLSLYIRKIEYAYSLYLLCIYIYMTFRLINYLPVKISNLREESVKNKHEHAEKKINVNIKDKLEDPINRWVDEKRFIHPDLTIKDVAMEIGTNNNYLSKYLNSIVGMTFSVWLHTLRIEESKVLLLEQNKMTIEEIGRQVGIPESYNFSRWFKTVTGITPQQFRKFKGNI